MTDFSRRRIFCLCLLPFFVLVIAILVRPFPPNTNTSKPLHEMSILEVFDPEDVILIFYLPVLLLTVPMAFRDCLRETPTRTACRWMIRELLFAHVLITLAPQLFLTGLLFFAYFVGFKHSVLCVLLTILIVLIGAMWPFHKRYEKVKTLQITEDSPQDHERLTKWVHITTAITLGYAFVAWFIFLYCFAIPEIVYASMSKHYGTSFLLGFATYFDSILVCFFPMTCRFALDDFLDYAKSDESFQWHQENFFERMARIHGGSPNPEEVQT